MTQHVAGKSPESGEPPAKAVAWMDQPVRPAAPGAGLSAWIGKQAAVVVLVGFVGVTAGPAIGLGSQRSAALGAACAFVSILIGLWVLRPDRAAPRGKWVMRMFAAQGAMFAATLLSGVVLYSSSRPDPLLFAAVAAGTTLGAMLVQIRALAPLVGPPPPG